MEDFSKETILDYISKTTSDLGSELSSKNGIIENSDCLITLKEGKQPFMLRGKSKQILNNYSDC